MPVWYGSRDQPTAKALIPLLAPFPAAIRGRARGPGAGW
jgi:hypothetical protein